MSTNISSRDDKETWPRSGRDYVFLAEAADAIGKRLFGGQWTGKEISAKGGSVPLEFQARSVWASGQAQEWSRALLRKYPSASTVEEACRLDSEARDRFVKVTQEIIDHCAWGRLVSAVRLESGSFAEMHRDRWNNPKPGWFARCQMPAAEAFNQSWGGKNYLPIFIRRAELDVLMGVAAPPVVVHASVSLPSPSGAAADSGGNSTVKQRKRRSQQQEIVKPFLKKLFPNGIPDISAMTDGALFKVVAAEMERSLPRGTAPKYDSVLRAAGRK